MMGTSCQSPAHDRGPRLRQRVGLGSQNQLQNKQNKQSRADGLGRGAVLCTCIPGPARGDRSVDMRRLANSSPPVLLLLLHFRPPNAPATKTKMDCIKRWLGRRGDRLPV